MLHLLKGMLMQGWCFFKNYSNNNQNYVYESIIQAPTYGHECLQTDFALELQ